MARSRTSQKKRRVRSPHPGVVLIAPSAVGQHTAWRARFKDPDSGKLTKVRVPDEEDTPLKRRDWAVRKSHTLQGRTLDIKSGSPRIRATPFADAVDVFFTQPKKPLRDSTKANYEAVAKKLLTWADKVGITKTDQLTRPRLFDFRTFLMNEKKKLHLKGSKRNELIETDDPRSPHTINGDFRKLKTLLGRLIDRGDGSFPRLTRDDLTVALEELDAELERVDYLKAAELRKLLEAALRHDAATFASTREEEAERRRLARIKVITEVRPGPGGTTERYEHKIAPFLAVLLLSGMRLGEALSLQWEKDAKKLAGHVELDELDDEGRKVGAIILPGRGNKTKKSRTIGLEVSPALRALLVARHLRTGGKGSVFGLTEGIVNAAIKRLLEDYGAPEFSPQKLRRTCGTFLTNAAGIFGGASAYRSGKQLGHATQTAEKHYLSLERGIPRDAHTVEAAMQIEDVMERIVARVGGSTQLIAGCAR